MYRDNIPNIAWHRFRHSYGNASDIPRMLRTLFDADLETWDQALESLINTIFHQNTVNHATALVMPFLVAYIADCPNEKKAMLLLTLLYIAESCVRDFHSLHQSRAYLDTFDNVMDGYPMYIQLLRSPQIGVRFFCVQLLSFTQNNIAQIRIKLYHALRSESDPMMIWACLIALSRLCDAVKPRVLQKYRQLFTFFAEQHPDNRVKIAASAAWLYSRHNATHPSQPIPSSVIKLIGFLMSGRVQIDWDFFYPPEYDVNDDLRKLTIYELAELLKLDDIAPLSAHIVVREMLDAAFPRVRSNDPKRTQHFLTTSWSYYASSGSNTETHYQVSEQGLVFDYRVRHPNKIFNQKAVRQFVLEQIIKCNVFWQYPTNLLSYIYGLPDDQNSLKRMIHENN